MSSKTPAKRERVPTRLRKQVWDRVENPLSSEGKCVVCRSYIHILYFECAHIVSVADGGKTTVDNLLPCCGMCNRSMGKMNLFEYMEKYHPENLKYCIYYSGKSASSDSSKTSAQPQSQPKSRQSSKTSSSKKEESIFESIASVANSVIGLFHDKKRTPATSSTTSATTSHCAHILERGENKGEYCSVKPVIGSIYCSRHNRDKK